MKTKYPLLGNKASETKKAFVARRINLQGNCDFNNAIWYSSQLIHSINPI